MSINHFYIFIGFLYKLVNYIIYNEITQQYGFYVGFGDNNIQLLLGREVDIIVNDINCGRQILEKDETNNYAAAYNYDPTIVSKVIEYFKVGSSLNTTVIIYEYE